jgi:hypothetical protein
MKAISFFYPGKHTDYHRKKVTTTKEDLAKAVALFNSSGQKLPLVVGHPSDEDDSFGYATKLSIDDNGVVKAVEFADVDLTFKKIVNSKELPKVSVKMRLAGHPANRTPDTIEFQHLGFFGRSDVALDKLPLASFGSPGYKIDYDSRYEGIFMAEVDFEEREAELNARMAAIEAKEAEFKAMSKVLPLVNKLVTSGAVVPADQSGLVSIFCKLSAIEDDSFTSSFGQSKDGDDVSAIDFLAAAFSKKAVPMGEDKGYLREEGEDSSDDASAIFGMSGNMKGDEKSAAMDAKVRAYMKKNNCSYAQAYKKVGGDE